MKTAKKFFFFPFYFLCCALFLASCEKIQKQQQLVRNWMLEEEKIPILCTTEYVSALVKAVGKEHVHVLTLIPSHNDPHSYQLVKGDADKFQKAAIIFYSGAGLEHQAGLLKKLHSTHAIPIANQILENHKKLPRMIQNDPHLWMNIALWAEGASIIADHLSSLYPHLRSFLLKNATETVQILLKVHRELQRKIAQIPPAHRYLVTSHNGFSYFCYAYLATEKERTNGQWHTRTYAPEGLSPESQISTQDLQETIRYIDQHHVKTLFAEYGSNNDSLQKIIEVCHEKQISVHLSPYDLFADVMKGKEMTGYLEMMHHNINILICAWKKDYENDT